MVEGLTLVDRQQEAPTLPNLAELLDQGDGAPRRRARAGLRPWEAGPGAAQRAGTSLLIAVSPGRQVGSSMIGRSVRGIAQTSTSAKASVPAVVTKFYA